MTSSLVGSEMCIRDRKAGWRAMHQNGSPRRSFACIGKANHQHRSLLRTCLLYTSDAADDM
eukprot:8471236-Prorocentrum_lima.AAC.1